MNNPREPIFNIPSVVVVVLAVLVLIHVVRVYVLPIETDRLFVWTFAFVPARYSFDRLLAGGWEYGWSIWTFVTYAFIHADLMHLTFNSVWLLAFGGAVARRFGATRFMNFYALTAAAGAVAHLLTHADDIQPMIGASGSISGTMGAATRFAFLRGGPLDHWRSDREHAYLTPAPPLLIALRNPRVMSFVGAWFALNLIFGFASSSIIGEDQTVAWEAHAGGFLAGLLLFAMFDPVRPYTGYDDGEAGHTLH